MIALELKKALIQSAIQGKLTSNFVTDEDYSKIFNPKDLTSNTDELIDVPSNWGFALLSEVAEIRNGFTPNRNNSEFWNSNDIPWFTIEDIRKQGRIIEKTSQHISEKALSGKKRIVPKNSILLCCTASIGEYALTKIDLVTNQQFNGISVRRQFDKYIDIRFLYYWIQTLKSKLSEMAGKTTFQFLSTKKLGSLKLNIPPISEQKRIVEKLEEMLPIIDSLEKEEKKLEDIMEKFPESMKTSILQAAIQGKLTSNFVTDEDYSKIFNPKDLTSNTDELIDVPSNWGFALLSEVAEIRNGFTPNRNNSEFWNSNDIPWFTIEDIRKQGRIIEKTSQHISEKALSGKKRIVPKNSILLCCTASIGEYALTKIDLVTNQQFNGISVRRQFDKYIDIRFLYYWIQTLKSKLSEMAGKTTFQFLSTKKLGSLKLNIPPISEQKRIVEKLEEMLPIIEKINY